MKKEKGNNSINLDESYEEAIRFAKKHYENFPVVSFLIPKRLRKHVAIIYWFARTADDIADEGTLSGDERIKLLEDFENDLKNSLKNNSGGIFELTLINTIREMNLSTENFFDLIKAFKQDVIKMRYKNFDQILEYCRFSANPVGRLILELFGIRNEEALLYSDKICTALQLANFYQDISIDYKKGRIYLTEDEMEDFSVPKKVFELNENNLNFKRLLKFNVDRTQQLFNEGKSLFKFLKGRLKFEIKWTVYGGEAILSKIRSSDYQVLQNRPDLSVIDFFKLFLKALFTNE
jgi:squalene synthase HpnC